MIYILLPGFAIALLIKLPLIKSRLEWFGLSYLSGWCADLILYLIYEALPSGDKAKRLIFTLLVFLISTDVIIYELSVKEHVIEKDIRSERICLTLTAMMLTAYILVSYGANYIPYAGDTGYIYGDTVYWIQNTISLTKGFPPFDFRNYPDSYNYHYLSSMQNALITLITGIRPAVTATVFHFIQPALLICTGGYVLFRKLSDSALLSGIAAFMMLFSTGLEDHTIVTYMHHIYASAFGFDYGLGLFLWGILFAYEYFMDEKPGIKSTCLLAAICAITTGTKGPAGVAFVMITGFICLDKLIKKQYPTGLLTGILVLLSFILIYHFIVNVRGYAGEDTGSYIASVTAGDTTGSPRLPLPVFFFFLNPAVTILYLVSLTGLKKHRINLYSAGLFITAAVLDILTLTLHMYGSSEMYFSMLTPPILLALAAYNLRELKSRKLLTALTPLMAAGVLFALLTDYENRMTSYIHVTLEHMRGRESRDIHIPAIKGSDVRKSESLRQIEGDFMICDTETGILDYIAEKPIIKDDHRLKEAGGRAELIAKTDDISIYRIIK